MSALRLLLDAGNSRLKWAVLDGDGGPVHGVADYAELSPLADVLRPGMSCHIASVARPQHEHVLNALLAKFAIKPKWLTSDAPFPGLRNAYANPRELGVDRWMSLVGARQRSDAPTLVVSAGTATTVDALSADGEFVGGVIVPGYTLMQQSLQQGTARVRDVAGSVQAFPRCTADAVESGIIAALCGAIRSQHARLGEWAGATPRCLVTGGDAERLLPHLALPAEHVPHLVLEGIARVAREDGTE